MALRLACCGARARWGSEDGEGGGVNTILYDGNRFYLTTPTDAEVDPDNLAGYPINCSCSGSVNVLTRRPHLGALPLYLEWPAAESAKATNDFNKVVSSKNDMKYYVSVDGSGNDAECRYYLVNALNRP